MVSETEVVKSVAGLMVVAARTAPKAMGFDSIIATVVYGNDIARLANEMEEYAKEKGVGYFSDNAKQIRKCDAIVLIGVKGWMVVGANCGGCGYHTCREFTKAVRSHPPTEYSEYPGPNCVIKVTDLGVALGSAVKCASQNNVDNRVMYTVGVVAQRLHLMDACTMVYGIPLNSSGKNIFYPTKI
ncbi:ferredoxin domain-containing protein [Methanorbis rubei]|uniref:4Fe-4S domain-containing protein n=1 Tax=Methanorbis rubei TaxID=3028300 RepID=A0AAE4MFP6_9EURY|nr:hypothetical protein [Methanocorpusculaceae archaeon Cs1]